MADDDATSLLMLSATVIIVLFITVLFVSSIDSPVNYPLSTEVTTTDEYNAHSKEFTGHIVMQKMFGIIVVENKSGERKEFEAQQLRKALQENRLREVSE